MNVLKMSNAKKGPHKSFNAFKDYSDKELNAQIVAMTMTYFQMQDYGGMLNYCVDKQYCWNFLASKI